VTIGIPAGFSGDLIVHIHPDDGRPIDKSSIGSISDQAVVLKKELLATTTHFEIQIS
jgi:hypothetical protein